MEDNQVIRSMDVDPIKKRSKKSIILAGLLLVLALSFSAGAYFLGRKSGGPANTSPTPTQSIFPTSFEQPTTEPVSSVSATVTKSASPTITPSASPTPAVKTKIISSKSSLDGFRSSNNGGNNSLDIRAGRNSNLVTRGFVTFDITSIPSGANIESATMRLYQAKTVGSPYSAGGALKVDHLTYGDSLDSTDYSLPALTSNFATLTSNATVEWKDANVTDQVKNDMSNARSTSQFRIHFTTEATGGNVTGDFAYFDSANSYTENSGHTPQLVVKYY